MMRWRSLSERTKYGVGHALPFSYTLVRGGGVSMQGAIYARYSTSRQNPKSIRDQIQICRSYAEREGITIVKEYTDEERSGYSTQREGLLQLLKDAESEVFDVLLVEHTSRLARDGLELRKLLNEFRFRYQIPIIFVSQNLRTDREQDLAIIKLFNIVDEQYIEGIKIATKRGLEGVFRQGKWTGGTVPFGYTLENGYLRINPEEAEVVRWIYQEYARGIGIKTLCKELNKGIRTRKGNPWSASSLSNLLKNPIYKGVVIWGRRRFVEDPLTGKVRVYENNNPIQRQDPALRIVEGELWEECNRRLAKIPHGKPRRKKLHPLAGILKCGVCGYHFSKEGNKLYCSSYRTRKSCTNDISLDYPFLFRWLAAQVKKFIELNKDTLIAKMEELKTGRSHTALQQELKRLKRKLKNLYDLYSEDPSDALKEKINEVKHEIKTLEEELLKAGISAVNFQKALDNFEKVLHAKPEEANRLLQMFCEEIVITPKDGIVNIRVKQGSNLSKILGIKSIAGAGFEPATFGL